MRIEVYSPTIRRKEMDAVLTAMVEDKIGPGEQAKILIQTAREKLHFDYCLALRSPAIALYLALKIICPQKGQGVVVSALSPLYYRQVIEDLGLLPIFCDVLSSSAGIDREAVKKAIAFNGGAQAGCIIVHHTLGYLSDVAAIAELGLPIIEDCSQSYGSLPEVSGTEDEKPGEIGSGIFTILGLEERDMLTCGGGALLYSMNRRDAAMLRGLGDLPPEYGLPDMNAALAVVQFREAAKNLLKRKEIVNLYSHSVLRTRYKLLVQNDVANTPIEYNNYAFPIVLSQGMKDLKVSARRKDIAVETAFEKTLAGSGLVLQEQCPQAYSLSLRTILFPLYPRLRMKDAERVAKLIQALP